jgi:NADH-quinone oxidoreductase subunit H
MQNHGLLQPATLGIVGLGLGALLLGGIAVSYLVESRRRPEVDFEADERPFDAFAGGYPVPPLPGQVLPELADVVVGERADTAPDNREGDDL